MPGKEISAQRFFIPQVVGSWPICPSFIPSLSKHWEIPKQSVVNSVDKIVLTAEKNKDRECIVYSFGVANEWDFEHSMADLGCRVFAFDPTQEFRVVHENHVYPGVEFHFIGLGSESTEKYGGSVQDFSSGLYGNVAGPIKSLRSIMKDFNHSFIDVLKIDCEGCEWDAFGSTSNDPNILNKVGVLQLEVHFTLTLQVNNMQALKNMANFYSLLFDQLNFRLWYEHDNYGHEKDRTVHPILLELGAHPLVCCYELSFVNMLNWSPPF